MIETIQWNDRPVPQATSLKPVLRMTSNARTAGSMPIWEKVATPTQHVEQALSSVQDAQSVEPYGSAYQSPDSSVSSEEFTFGDLVDMANPLHHIPLVNIAYREITGDTIKPIGNIVGGAIFGGGVGAASGVVNAIIQAETGKDIGGNAVAMIRHGEAPTFKVHTNKTTTSSASREEVMHWTDPDQALQEDYSLALLSFSDLKQERPSSNTQNRPSYNE